MNKYEDMKDKKIIDVKAVFDDNVPGFDGNKSGGKSNKETKSKTPILDNYGRDLTRLAEEGKLDQIVGREKEIERVSQILSRRKKNNPILIGEPGCVDGDTIIKIKKVSNYSKHGKIEVENF